MRLRPFGDVRVRSDFEISRHIPFFRRKAQLRAWTVPTDAKVRTFLLNNPEVILEVWWF